MPFQIYKGKRNHTVRILKISPSTPIPLIGYRTCMTTSVCQIIKDEAWRKDCACPLQTRSICWIVNLYGQKSKRQSWLLNFNLSLWFKTGQNATNWIWWDFLSMQSLKSCFVQQDIVKYSNREVGWNKQRIQSNHRAHQIFIQTTFKMANKYKCKTLSPYWH